MEAVTARQGTDATLADVSNLIHKHPAWVRQQLDLLSLRADIQKAVERGEIPLQSAYMLAKLPRTWQVQFIGLAKTAPAKEFTPMIARLVKQVQEDARQGKLTDFCKDFEPVALSHCLAQGGLRRPRAGPLPSVRARSGPLQQRRIAAHVGLREPRPPPDEDDEGGPRGVRTTPASLDEGVRGNGRPGLEGTTRRQAAAGIALVGEKENGPPAVRHLD